MTRAPSLTDRTSRDDAPAALADALPGERRASPATFRAGVERRTAGTGGT
jgi:hypothetical protein